MVKLSQNGNFRRSYNSIHDVVSNFHKGNDNETKESAIQRLVGKEIKLESRPFHLIGIDATPAPRKFARTLEDRGYVYSPNTVGGKPVTVGHTYSLLAYLPEKVIDQYSPPWILPLSVKRIPTSSDDLDVGMSQLKKVLSDEQLPLKKELIVSVQDSKYGSHRVIKEQAKYDNLVSITRLRSNRVFNCQSQPFFHSKS